MVPTSRLHLVCALAKVQGSSESWTYRGYESGADGRLRGAPEMDKTHNFDRSKYGLIPTQRSFFAYEAANLAVDAIRRAGSDKPADIEAALKKSDMPSLLGGTYAMDDHNHPHTPMRILGVKDDKVAIIATVN